MNTLRLWLPQLFTTIDEYNQAHNYSGEASLCEMLSYTKAHGSNSTAEDFVMEECTVVSIYLLICFATITAKKSAFNRNANISH